MWNLKRWWHDGEEPGARVFRQSWRTTAVMGAAGAAVIWLVPALRNPAAYATFLLVLARGCLERRRAVILTPSSLGVRGPFAAARFVARSNVGRIAAVNVGGSFLLMPRPVKGLRISLRSGGAFYIPLDMPRRQRICDAIRSAALPPTGDGHAADPPPRKA